MEGRDTRRGVTLIVVLGALSVLILLAVAFARAMRRHRAVARNYSDTVRVEQLAHTALLRAMEEVDASLVGECYPLWSGHDPTDAHDALCSQGPESFPEILSAGAAREIPGSLLRDASLAATNGCGWIAVTNFGTRSSGRIAYLVVNCSGLLDANIVGGINRSWSTNVNELDLEGLPDFVNWSDFLADRDVHRRYESVPELAALNEGLAYAISNFFVYSYDPGRDEYFVDRADLGKRGIELHPRFHVNALTNSAAYAGAAGDLSAYRNDTAFMTNYMDPLRLHVNLAGLSNVSGEVSWNLVNYLDPDRLPHSDGLYPWREAVVEAVPLINEIVFQDASGAPSNHYEFAVELWFPFCPAEARPSDGFVLQVGVFASEASSGEGGIMALADPQWSFAADVGAMAFSNATEFLCFTSPPERVVSFPYTTTNAPGVTNYFPVSPSNSVWFLARVLKADGLATNPVDEAMGYELGNMDPADRRMIQFSNTVGYSVNDPRLNGRVRYWTGSPGTNALGHSYPPGSNTLGGMNRNCDPYSWGGQGLPLFHRDAPMFNIGEIGHICTIRENAAPGTERPWETVDLMSDTNGAALLDLLTVRPTNSPARGLVAINSGQLDVLETLFRDIHMGYSNSAFATPQYLLVNLPSLAQAVYDNGGDYVSFRHMYGLVQAFESSVYASIPTNQPMNDILREAPMRHIVDLVTFRQNVFTVILAAQVLGRDGVTVLAERRAIAVVCRDAYTGRSFIRSLRWLAE